jgi:hypothetical protein
MTILYILVAVLVVIMFELACWLAAADSRDDMDSPEWERRQTWRQNAG